MRNKLLPWQVEEVVRLGDKGWKSGRIARHLDLNQSTVNYQMLRNGFDPFGSGRPRGKNHPGSFSPDEDERLLDLARDGMSVSKIGREMKRAYTSVRLRLLLLEVRAENALEAA